MSPPLRPVALTLWSGSRPLFGYTELTAEGVVIGRGWPGTEADERMSRQHARVAFRDDEFEITDLGSRNGTNVGLSPLIHRHVRTAGPTVVRCGRTVVWLGQLPPMPSSDLQLAHRELAIGPSSLASWRGLQAAISAATPVVLVGDSGTGKTQRLKAALAEARLGLPVFDPLVHALELATVLGAAPGLVIEQADQLQPRHLAELEALRATQPGLRLLATARSPGSSYARALGAMELTLPPLMQRPEELAAMVPRLLAKQHPQLEIHATVVEHCLMQRWPGNLHQLARELTRAASVVVQAGKPILRGDDLLSDPQGYLQGPATVHSHASPTLLEPRRGGRHKSEDEP